MLDAIASYIPASSSGYWLTRFIILRLLGITFFFAFLSLVKQLIPLFGEKGMTPIKRYVQLSSRKMNHPLWENPSVFYIWNSDSALKFFAWTGLILSLMLTFGLANVPILFLLWFIYLSFVNVGQEWYGYGWESQLLETGFLAIFFVPLLNPSPFPNFAPPFPIIILFLWLAFRIYMGAGLIKLRADACWRELTALNWHFETQPIPNPLSRYFHFLPGFVKKGGVLLTHAVQIAAPVFLFVPGPARVVAGAFMVLFQIVLMLSGNLAFLNLVTIVPILAAFDDAVLVNILPSSLVQRAGEAAASASHSTPWLQWALLLVIAVLSYRPVRNLLSSSQVMNTSFDQFHIVNTYGAFGTVGRVRYELVVKGFDGSEWKEYEFKAKPTDVNRTPPVVAPYQPRIDWQIWFAAMQPPRYNGWMLTFIWKLLHNDKNVLKLIKNSPFDDAPEKVKVDRYIYKFAKPGSGKVWKREFVGEWLPALGKSDLNRYERMMGW